MKRKSLNLLMTAMILLSLLAWPADWPAAAESAVTIWYVKPGAAGGTCASWDTACDLHQALAEAGTGYEIWAAEGTYLPDPTGLEDPLTATFQLKSGVALFGGFPSGGGSWEQRDPAAHPTTLSGDFLGNDDPNDSNTYSDNSYHVVTGSGVTDTAILDGFFIRGGCACGFWHGPNIMGGGLFNISGSPTLRGVTISGNLSYYGGGMANTDSSSPTLTDVTFSNNYAYYEGGGMYNHWSSPLLAGVTFSGNDAQFGGGIENTNESSSVLKNVAFFGNNASWGGGMTNVGSSAALVNVTFSGNVANVGGGLYNLEGTFKVKNSILWGNDGGQIFGDADVRFSDIQGGWSCPSGDCFNIDQDPLFADAANGNLRLLPGSPAIDAGSNAAVPHGITTDLDGNPRFVDFTHTGTATVDMGAYETQLKTYLPLIGR